jgi:hypothetical protein
MGAHFGSILIRADQTTSIRPVLETIASEHKCKFLMGPSLRGWISIFPSDGGSDEQISAAIARELVVDTFHLTVFDSDIFAYTFYRDGGQRDEYNSRPDYFDECPPEEKERLRGKPDVFKDLLGSPEGFARLKELLARNDFTFEEERLHQFADLLGLVNAVGGYDYLFDGERDGISNWKQFVHIPDEKEVKRRAKALIKTEKSRLAKEGLLLAELLPPGPKQQAIHSCLHCCADTLRGGFLIGWGSMPDRPLLSFNPLKSKTPVESGLSLKDRFFSFEMSPSGKSLVISHGKTEVFNWPQKTIDFEVESPSRAADLGFDNSENHLIIAESGEIIVAALETGRIEFKFDIGSGGRGCATMHPDGKYLAAKHLNNFSLINLRTKQIEKTLECKGTISSELPATVEMDEMIENLQKIWSSKHLLKSDLPEDKFIMGGSLAGRRLSWPRTEGMKKFGFNPNGEMMFCATTIGMRVFRWSDLLLAVNETPKTVFSADCPTDDPNGGYVHDFFLDESRNQIVFCGSFGKICYLNLQTGVSGILLDPPEKISIRRMALSSDGIALCCTCGPCFDERNREVSRFQFWNYPALCKASGLD